MSPEQVLGDAIDQRSDIFAFGAVLYEMLTGRGAFKRDIVPETLSAILQNEPPAWSGDGTPLSTRLMRLARRCVEKAPDARFQSARDLMIVLSDEAFDTSQGLAPRPAPRECGRRSRQPSPDSRA
jgi:serine/threonine protein kinase